MLREVSVYRNLEAHGWKRLQRWTYGLALLTVFHGAAYQIAAKREAPLVFVLIVLAGVPAALQWLGCKRRGKRGGI